MLKPGKAGGIIANGCRAIANIKRYAAAGLAKGQGIGATAAVELVRTATGINRIISGPGIDCIVAAIAMNNVITIPGNNIFDRLQRISSVPGHCSRGKINRHSAVIGRIIYRVASVAANQRIVAASTNQHVVTGPAI